MEGISRATSNKNPLMKKIRGFQKAPRERFFLLKNGVLTHEEFLLYELGIAITDWDRDHTETYGTFQATNQALADILGWASDSTASRYKKSLVKKGYFLLIDENRLQVKGFNLWELKKSSAKKQDDLAKNEISPSILQEQSAKMQENQSKNTDSSLVSSKDHLSSTQESEETLSDAELDRIIFETGNLPIKNRIDQMTEDEQLNVCKEVFGEETKWAS